MDILIIEDEILTAQDIARNLKQIDSTIRIHPFVESVEEGLRFFEEGNPVDLIFSDIELGDGLSFEIFSKFEIKAPVIFCTAYEDYTLEAFDSFGISYILKPFDSSAIERSLEKYQTLKTMAMGNNTVEMYNGLIKSFGKKKTAFLVYKGEKIIPIKTEEVALFHIDGGQVLLLAFDGQKYKMKYTMDELEITLPNSFFRANRQIILNRAAVVDASQYFNRKLIANLSIKFPEKVIVGKLKTNAFLDWLSST